MIRTAGGDTHFWAWNGKPVPLENAMHIDYQAAGEMRDELARALGVANPVDWAKASKQKLASMIDRSGMRAKWKLFLDAAGKAGLSNYPKDPGETFGVVIWGPNQYANASINSGNSKTGPCLATNASQASCPDGKNNSAGFKCPLYGSGCYAESGPTAWQHTSKVNKATGTKTKDGVSGAASPEEVAADEAAALEMAHIFWLVLRLNNAVRGHVVGDCVNRKSAGILSRALELFAEPGMEGIGIRGSDPRTRNVWTYTHGWRSVPRSAWSPNISVLASCDRIEDLEPARAAGYGCAIVIPDYMQASIDEQTHGDKYSRKSFQAGNGWKLIPCPHEVNDKNDRDQRAWCIECGLCMKDQWLRETRSAIAFAAHTKGAQAVSSRLVQLENTGATK